MRIQRRTKRNKTVLYNLLALKLAKITRYIWVIVAKNKIATDIKNQLVTF